MSDLHVQVAVPYRFRIADFFIRSTQHSFDKLTFKNKELNLFGNEFPPDGRKYSRNARARNEWVKTFLRPSTTHVLWLDADLTWIPHDLIERLLAVDDKGIVAPYVYVEMLNPSGYIDWNNGGWFYDTGGFTRNGVNACPFHPPFSGVGDTPFQLDSVGCCYIVPAWLYREGCSYEPAGDQVEHLSFCAQAREKGVSVWADPTLKVYHAFLPAYGEAWHS